VTNDPVPESATAEALRQLDILELKQAELAIRESEDRFRSLFENSIDAVLLATGDGTVLAANPEACRIFGRTEDEICRIGRRGLVDDPRLAELLAEREISGRFKGELTFVRKDGSRFPGEVSSAVYKDRSGAPRASVIIRDITERKQAEEALRAIAEGTASLTGNEFFRALVQNLARALRVRYAFVAECRSGGMTRARSRAFWDGARFGDDFEYDVPGTPCADVLKGEVCFHGAGVQALFPQDKDLVALGVQCYLGIPLVGVDGRVIGHIAVLDDKPMERADFGTSVLRVFAGRAGAELERLKAEEREQTLLELNNSIITCLKLPELLHATCQALKHIVAFDRAAVAIYDPAANDLRVYALEGAFAPDKLVVGQMLDRQGHRGHEPFDFRRPVMRRDLETERRYSFDEGLYAAGIRSHCALPLVAGGETIGILGIGAKARNQYSESDFEFLQEIASQIALAIANVKAYAEIDDLKTRLQEENVYLRRELIANVSHDLRSPLASLRGYLETLLIKEDTLTPAKRRSYLEIAARQTEHLQTLISELFELAKLDFQGYELNPEPVHLGELTQDVLQKFQLAAEKKDIVLRVDVHPKVGFVRADMALIERALENLLENALKHTGPGGRISLAVSPQEGRVEVQVTDTGSGIPAQDLPHIFERFYRVDKARTRDSGGAGLGLAIVKRILDLHHGKISVTSEPMAGTTFSFALPVAEAVRLAPANAELR
jgi:PAS domain S-box-containing protein